MKSVHLLIDMAREKVGSDAELARRIGESRQNLAGMKAGRRPITPETVATLCDVLDLPGDECREWVALAIIQNPKNAARKTMLERALFACGVLGVGSLMSLPNDARAMLETSSSYRLVTHSMHIVAHLLRMAASAVRVASWLCRTRSRRSWTLDLQAPVSMAG